MRVLVAAIIAAILACAGPAGADTPDEDLALAHLQRGVDAFDAGDYPRALRELTIAHDLAPDRPNPYRWLALTQVQLGDCPAALGNIDGFLARVPLDEPRVGEMVRLRELCTQIGVLHVESSPSPVALRIDDVDVGETPYHGLSMRAGAHTLVAQRPGYARVSRTIDLPAGGELTVRLELAAVQRPLTRRWWFWPTVVGGAAAITGAIVLVTRDPGATLLPPVVCDDAGCRAEAR